MSCFKIPALLMIVFLCSETCFSQCIQGICTDGVGSFLYEDGSKYTGSWKDGKKNGNGTFLTRKQNKYSGNFKDDKMDGKFTVEYASGSKYFGDFLNDIKSGKGEYTWVDGKKYTGEFREDEATGLGVMKYADGSVYTGEFIRFGRNGKGKFIASNGDVKEGIWESDSFKNSDNNEPKKKVDTISKTIAAVTITSENMHPKNSSVSQVSSLENNDVPGKQSKKIITTGVGVNTEKATTNAALNAIQQIVGTYITSESMLQNKKLIKDQVLSHSNAFVKNINLRNVTKDSDGLVVVEAEVDVEFSKLSTFLKGINESRQEIDTTGFVSIVDAHQKTIDDFESLSTNLILKPFDDISSIYKTEIVSTSKSAVYDVKNGCIPIQIDFKVSLSQDYLKNMLYFFEKNSDKIVNLNSGERFDKDSLPHISTNTIVPVPWSDGVVDLKYNPNKVYIINTKYKDVFNRILSNMAKKDFYLLISFLNNVGEPIYFINFGLNGPNVVGKKADSTTWDDHPRIGMISNGKIVKFVPDTRPGLVLKGFYVNSPNKLRFYTNDIVLCATAYLSADILKNLKQISVSLKEI